MPEKSDHDLLTEVHSCLIGINGQGGLMRDFANHKKSDTAFRKDYYEFKRRMIGILCFAAGSGALGISIAKILGG